MKRILSVLLLLTMLLTVLTGCPTPGDGGSTTTTTTTTTTTGSSGQPSQPSQPSNPSNPSEPSNPDEPETPLSTAKIGGIALSEFLVIYGDDSTESVAASLAAELSLLSGTTVEYNSRGRNANQIILSVENTGNASTVSDKAHMSMSGTKLTISADNRNTLSYAVSALLADLRENKDVAADVDADISLPTKFYKASDTALFKYCGYWAATDAAKPDVMISYWNTAYVEIAFSGNVITVHFDTPTTFEARIDKGEYTTCRGLTEKTFFAEGSGTHVLRIYNNNRIVHLAFSGASAGEDVSVTRAPNKAHYIQFVGDSLTDTTVGYAQQVAEKLDFDFCVTARSGIAVQTDKSWWGYDNATLEYIIGENLGMRDVFFKLGLPTDFKSQYFPDLAIPAMLNHAIKAAFNTSHAGNYINAYAYTTYRNGLSDADKAKLDAMVNTLKTGGKPDELVAAENALASFLPKWKSNAFDLDTDSLVYKPDVVFIMLGTNDGISGGPTNASYTSFVDEYLAFAEEILNGYGNGTGICVMNCLKLHNGTTDESRYQAIDEVATKLKAKYPGRITSISSATTKEWIKDLTFPDGLHPDEASHKILADKMAPVLGDLYD